MKIGLIIILITVFLLFDTYYDSKYTKMLHVGKKYIQMATYGFIGLSFYLFLKKHPAESKNMFSHANNIIRYMPIDKGTTDILTPIFDMTNKSFFTSEICQGGEENTPQFRRMLNSGGNNRNKRSVSETKKKYVASQQDWKCGHCKKQLSASFEVDHIIRLENGGTNNIDNLVALCRNCHGEKTVNETL